MEALERKYFSYRKAIGELIWPMVTTRIDISFPTVKLSQYSSSPAAVHYLAVKHVFRYLAGTIDDGLTYWRITPLDSLPHIDPPTPRSDTIDPFHDVSGYQPKLSPSSIYGYIDTDWGMNINNRRSIIGLVYILAGAAVGYKTRVMPPVAQSSTESEFYGASDGGKFALYLRSILDELGIEQRYATIIFEDNRGARMMCEAGQPTRNSRHIDIRHYVVLDWVERDLVTFTDVPSNLNAADNLTKQTARILFHRHNDILTGRHPPFYIR